MHIYFKNGDIIGYSNVISISIINRFFYHFCRKLNRDLNNDLAKLVHLIVRIKYYLCSAHIHCTIAKPRSLEQPRSPPLAASNCRKL